MFFLDYLQHSPFGPVLSMFARCGYLKDVRNLSHILLIIEVDYSRLNSERTNFVDDLIHATILEIVRSEDVHKMIEDGVFENIDSYFDMLKRCFKVSSSYLQCEM